MKRMLLPLIVLFSFASYARTMNVTHLQNAKTYFSVKVTDPNSPLNGTWPGWCADWATHIDDGIEYDAPFWSTLADVPNDVVDHPEFLDNVNWIINQDFVGKMAPDNLGVFTSGDVQLAIWSLVDNEFDASTVGPFSQARVDYIVDRAKVLGEGYEPGCRKLVGIILLPKDPSDGHRTQNTIILIPRYKFPKCNVPDTDTTLNLEP